MGRRYYHPKRSKRSGGLLRTLAVTLFTAWLGRKSGHGQHYGYRPHRPRSMKQAAIGHVLKRLARRFT